MALRYVERFATTRGKLADYLRRKVRERGWAGEQPADPVALAERMAALGYVDDRAYAEMKAAALTRRGLGTRRVAVALKVARIDADAAAEATDAVAGEARRAAIVFARRRRLGPFGAPPADRAARERQVAAMLRAGHSMTLARMIVDAKAPLDPDDPDEEALQNRCDDDEAC
ncbi:RecX family transcriptional regulator [Sphingomonas jinjuensis]|nr:RecX family transcriptional regulator [Sphingomonas jinjuensis]